MGKLSLADQIVALACGKTDDGYPEDVEDHDTRAKVVDKDEEDETSNVRVTRSALRSRNVKPLNEQDERYAGAKISRSNLNKSTNLRRFGNKVGLKKKKVESSSDSEITEEDEDGSYDDLKKSSKLSRSKNKVSWKEVEDEIQMVRTDSGSESESTEDSDDDGSSLDNSDDDNEVELAGRRSRDESVEDSPNEQSEVEEIEEEKYEDDLQIISAVDTADEIAKGKATQQQLRIWDTLLEVRIRMQKMLLESNKLPQTSSLPKIIEASISTDDIKLTSSLEKSRSTIKDFLETLVELQETMIMQNPDTVIGLSKKRKAPEQEGGDEEITSSEDEANEEEVEDEEDEVLVPKKTGKNGKPRRKKRKMEEFDTVIQKNFEEFVPYRNQTIQKWNDKTQLSFGKFGKKNASAQEVNTIKQIQHILSDKSRLIKRTQIKRGAYQTIGKSLQSSETDEALDQRDEEIFDDDDFYHQLLRELIERKTSNLNDPVQLSRHWLELQKLRSKLKRKVDTKASKGRKIRYDVHTKLVNFMAPLDHSSMSEHASKELMNSLFGGRK